MFEHESIVQDYLDEYVVDGAARRLWNDDMRRILKERDGVFFEQGPHERFEFDKNDPPKSRVHLSFTAKDVDEIHRAIKVAELILGSPRQECSWSGATPLSISISTGHVEVGTNAFSLEQLLELGRTVHAVGFAASALSKRNMTGMFCTDDDIGYCSHEDGDDLVDLIDCAYLSAVTEITRLTRPEFMDAAPTTPVSP